MTNTMYDHWRNVPEGGWRWPNFSPAEIACRGTGKLLVNEAALDRLRTRRYQIGKCFVVRSPHRSYEHATRSTHLERSAFEGTVLDAPRPPLAAR